MQERKILLANETKCEKEEESTKNVYICLFIYFSSRKKYYKIKYDST